MTFSKTLHINGLTYQIKAPSSREHKKYDVYLGDSYLLSFGDKRYQQYKDKLGYYKALDHGDDKRRILYNIRHRKDGNTPYYAGWWARKYLW